MALGVLALLILAAGLNTLTLQPGRVFQQPTVTLPQQGQSPDMAAPPSGTLNTLMRGLLALLLVLFPLSVIFALFSKEGRRRLLTNILMIAMLLLILNRVQENQQQARENPQPEGQAASSELPGVQGEPLPPPPAPPSDQLVLIASVAIVVFGVALAVFLARRWLFPPRPTALVQIAAEADRARDALAAGGALEDVVVRSYRQMIKIVAEARELRRSPSATPREFEDTLAGAGLPYGPLDDLTKLFEQVRYGGLSAGPKERQAAIDSLTAIAAACRAEQRRAMPGGRASRPDAQGAP